MQLSDAGIESVSPSVLATGTIWSTETKGVHDYAPNCFTSLEVATL